MPSANKQINVRADDETRELIDRLIPAVSAAIGLSVSQSDLFRLGLKELERRYLTGSPPASAPAAPPQPPTVTRTGAPPRKARRRD